MHFIASAMKTTIPLALAVAALQACASQNSVSSSQSTTTASTVDTQENHPFVHVVPWPTLGNGVERDIHIQLGPDALARCHNVSPKFPFDSADTLVDAGPELEALATCLNHPSMMDQTILLVGRTDPRGSSEYNDKLGLDRARTVADFLIHHGVDAARVEVVSQGKEQATTEARPDFSFGYDRRVDVIVRGTHTPR